MQAITPAQKAATDRWLNWTSETIRVGNRAVVRAEKGRDALCK